MKTAYGIIPSDGLALWRAVFMKEERINALLAAYYIHEAHECFEDGRHVETQKWAEAGLKKYPDNEFLTNYLGISLLEQLRLDDARRLFLGQIHPPAKNVLVYAMALNNLAYADVLTEDPTLLEEAEKCSGLAMAKLAWHPSIKGTRGAVFLQTGRIEEGVKLLQEAVASHENNKSKAINACFLAIAQRKLGNLEAADSYLKLAETLDPNCVLLARARRTT